MTHTRVLIVILTAALACSAVAVAQQPKLNPGRGRLIGAPQLPVQLRPKEPVDPQADLIGKLNQADLVFTGTVASVRQGPTAMSYPPIYSFKITFSTAKVLKGKPATIKPGESVSGEINSLKLKDVPWPRGGSRVYLRFCLGEKSDEAFLYYYSKHHDKLRDAAQSEEK